jgi:7,8-dihydropterin-6-yl-methyl-4-(beta-D-ribofuranosyl)aminobenzene 5'-phosphate synthase
MGPITRRQAIKKGSRLVVGVATGAAFSGLLAGCLNREPSQDLIRKIVKETEDVDIRDIRLTVAYDNVEYTKGFQSDWGFSCLIEGLDKTILFDSGRYEDVFMSNISRLRIDPDQIDELFISHDHPDHSGGVMKLLEVRKGFKVTLVNSFNLGFKRAVINGGSQVVEIDQPAIITKNCISTGEMKALRRNEHALVVLTNQGSIIITGCAHPGVVDIVERTKKLLNKDVLLLVGGYHLMSDHASSIRKKALRIKELGVRFVAPTHCSGGEAMQIFAKEFGGRFLNSGLGRTITVQDLA